MKDFDLDSGILLDRFGMVAQCLRFPFGRQPDDDTWPREFLLKSEWPPGRDLLTREKVAFTTGTPRSRRAIADTRHGGPDDSAQDPSNPAAGSSGEPIAAH